LWRFGFRDEEKNTGDGVGGNRSATAVVLIAVPAMAGRVLLATELSDSGVAVARVGGCGLLALGWSCWPSGDDASPQSVRALLVYNLLAGLYLGFLRVRGEFVSPVLSLASGLHVLLAVLFARAVVRNHPH
jgi:hypothetical protein